MGIGDQEFANWLRLGLNKIKILESCIEQLQIDIELRSAGAGGLPQGQPAAQTIQSNKVFVVHGHNHGIKESVARFLEKLDLEPIILHEKPNAGRTVIEKFSDYADVQFAVVLLTADDLGKPHDSHQEAQLRARQNVILELGYFLGKLGRARVCALYETRARAKGRRLLCGCESCLLRRLANRARSDTRSKEERVPGSINGSEA